MFKETFNIHNIYLRDFSIIFILENKITHMSLNTAEHCGTLLNIN